MKLSAALAAWMIGVPAIAGGACGEGATVRDVGLHLQWVVERDCVHPERPAWLVEVPWTAKAAVAGRDPGEPVRQAPAEVHSGMTILLSRRSGQAEIQLSGTALGTAHTGERVRVRAGMGAAALEGIVRGPGLVELLPRKDGY